MRVFGIPEYDAGVLTAERELADYFEQVVKIFPNAKAVSNWMMTEFMRSLKGSETGIKSAPVQPSDLADLLSMMEKGIISGKIGKTVFEEMWTTGTPPNQIVRERGLVQVSDITELTDIISKILSNNPVEVSRYLGGKTQLMAFFVGQVMKATKGKANPQIVNEILAVELEKLRN